MMTTNVSKRCKCHTLDQVVFIKAKDQIQFYVCLNFIEDNK